MLRTIFLFVLVTCVMSCMKEEDERFAKLNLEISLVDSGDQVRFDQLNYQNAFSETFSVSKFEIYLSDIEFHSRSGSTLILDDVHYFDAENKCKIVLDSLERVVGDSISITIGVPNRLNFTQGLPNTIENSNMAWPDPMGGGYHHFKFEGHYLDSTNIHRGFTFHTGTPNCVRFTTVKKGFELIDSHNWVLEFDLQKLFQAPNTIKLNEINYTMGDQAAMNLIADNFSKSITLKNKD